MKKFGFLLSLLLMALCVGFTSCSDDDDEKQSDSIVGKWQSTWYSGWEMDNGEKETWSEAFTEAYFTFNSDGTGTLEEEDCYEIDDFTWKISDNKLIVDYDGEVEVANIKKLNGTTLVLQYVEEDGCEEFTFKKIK